MSGIVDYGLRLLNQHFEVTAILVLGANPLGVFIEFGGIVGLREQILQKDGVWDPDGLQILHRTAQNAAVDVLISFEGNLTDLDFGSFLDQEGEAHGVWRDGMNLGPNRRVLSSVLSQQLLDRDLGLLYLGRIVLAFDGQSDFRFLEAVQHVAFRNRVQAFVINLSDGRTFLDIDMQDPPFRSLLSLK